MPCYVIALYIDIYFFLKTLINIVKLISAISTSPGYKRWLLSGCFHSCRHRSTLLANSTVVFATCSRETFTSERKVTWGDATQKCLICRPSTVLLLWGWLGVSCQWPEKKRSLTYQMWGGLLTFDRTMLMFVREKQKERERERLENYFFWNSTDNSRTMTRALQSTYLLTRECQQLSQWQCGNDGTVVSTAAWYEEKTSLSVWSLHVLFFGFTPNKYVTIQLPESDYCTSIC